MGWEGTRGPEGGLASRRGRAGQRALAGVLLACAIPGCNDDGVVIRVDDAPSGEAASADPLEPSLSEDDLNPRLLRRFVAISPFTDPRSARADLGRSLYFDPRLSSSGEVSCNTCHPLAAYGATSSRVSTGVFGRAGSRNAPSTYNTSGHFRQFWDGRVKTLEEQVLEPLQNVREMDMSPEKLERTLLAISGYPDLFARAFPEQQRPIRIENVATAVAEFEQGLTTPSRWDRYVGGERSALSAEEKRGARLFANSGCMVCHSGAYLGAATFEKLGVRVPWPDQRDRGRGQVSGNPTDDMIFKVPGLRNVARTAPYFHDGSTDDLDEAIDLMARHQLGLELLPGEIQAIATWLGSLTGELPQAYITPPTLPGMGGP